MESISELVYNREYKKLKSILDKEIKARKLSRLEMNTLRMITNLDKLSKGIKIDVDEEITCNESDHFGRVFECLRKNNYLGAYKYLQLTVEKANDPEEFQTYLNICEDIVYYLDVNNIKNDIKNAEISYKNYLDEIVDINENDIDFLEDLIYRRINMKDSIDMNVWYEKISINILEMIRLCLNERISRSYFDKVKKSDTHEKTLIDAFEYGDYVTAFDYLSKYDYGKYFPNLDKNYLLKIKKLLDHMDKKFYRPVDVTREESYYEINIDPSYLEIEEDCVNGLIEDAFVTAINSRVISEELIVSLAAALIINETNKEYYLNEYIKASNSGDFTLAKEKLDEYVEVLKVINPNRELDYHYQRLDSKRKQCENGSYEELLNIINRAKKLFFSKKYEAAISVIDLYNSIDNGLSAKGYMLRGRCNKELGRMSDAIKDFTKATEIISEPNAYYELAELYYCFEDYDKAYQNILEFQKRRPNKNSKAYKILSELSRIKGLNEEAMLYKKKSEYLEVADKYKVKKKVIR